MTGEIPDVSLLLTEASLRNLLGVFNHFGRLTLRVNIPDDASGSRCETSGISPFTTWLSQDSLVPSYNKLDPGSLRS